MDESGSIGATNYHRMKNFVYSIVETFNISQDHVRVAMVTYSTNPRVRFHLNTHSTKSSLLEAIKNLPYPRGGTYTHKALNKVRDSVLTTGNGARPSSEGVPRIVIVITDGRSTKPSKTAASAADLHDMGYIVFAIGIKGADEDELNAIASTEDKVFFISNFDEDELESLQISVSQEACTGMHTMMELFVKVASVI